MLTSKLFFGSVSFAALALVAAGSLAGCAADTSSTDADEGVAEESSDELNAAGKALIGSYTDDTGAFQGLVLTSKKVGQRNEFFADVDTGLRCITTPCPTFQRIEGTFTAGSKTITLYSTTASIPAQHLLGKYNYVVQGDKLTLTRKNFSQSLAKGGSYCAKSDDCYAQDIIHPMCMGGFTCTPQNTCAWKCGTWPPPPVVTVCLHSGTCAAGEHCSTEDGVCNPYGMLAVCAGTCVANAGK